MKDKKTTQRIPNPMSLKLLTLKQASEVTGLSVWTLRTLYFNGALPGFRLPNGGRKLFLRAVDLESLIETHTRKFA